MAPDTTAASGLRIATGLFLLLCFTPTFSWMAGLPEVFFHPPPLSLAAAFDRFPGRLFFALLDLGSLLAAAALTVGLRARWAGLTLGALLITGFSFQFSLGKIDHFSLLPVSLLLLSFSDWGTKRALLPDRPLQLGRLPWAILAICLAFGMLTAGYYKARGWIDFDPTQIGILNWYYTSQSVGIGLLPEGGLLALPPPVLEALDYAAVVFELIPCVLLFTTPRAWRAWITVACGFHLATTLLLGISFVVHVPMYLAFLLPSRSSGQISCGPSKTLIGVTAIGLVYQVALRASGHPSPSYLLPGGLLSPQHLGLLDSVLWTVVAAYAAWVTLKARGRVKT